MRLSIRLFFLAFILAALGACDRAAPRPEAAEPPVAFGSGTVVIETEADSHTIGVEVAETDRQRRVGLMRRTSMDPDSGMIFLFDTEQPPDAVFWMYNTLIPLSIAFIGDDGTIRNIRHMEPCTSPYPQWCPNYAAGVPYMAALEVNQGYFEERGIGIGDRVVVQR